MDFFDHQDRARRNTGRLVFLFILAVLGIIASTYVLVVACTVGFKYTAYDVPVGTMESYTEALDAAGRGEDIREVRPPRPPGALGTLLRWDLLGYVGLGVLAVVGGGSLYKTAQLAGGGHIVALHLGGRPISGDTTDPAERKVLNVIEEMAIASGVPVPPVFLLDDEPGINAFAAGYSPGDAVVGVTRGCVEKLTRDQLQGVVAHEFSHILNGDMRLNIRLIGVLHGILLVGLIGYYVFRSALYSGHHRSSRDRGSNPLPLVALGAGLMAVGFIGTFFGNMIKAAVSRQREFLADASAVQFTRNPDGIAGALKVIGGYDNSRVLSPNAPEASHMFFGQAITSGLSSLFATHPPLPERIARIDRYWEVEKAGIGAVARAPAVTVPGAAGLAGAERVEGRVPGPALDHVGQPTDAHVAHAHELIAHLPASIVHAAHEPFGACALVYAMLLDRDEQMRRNQMEQLERLADPHELVGETLRLAPLIEQLNAEHRLPLIDIAIGSLSRLSPGQFASFARSVRALVAADKKISLFEWVIQRIVLRHLESRFRGKRVPTVRHTRLESVRKHIAMLLSVLAYAGHRTPEQAAHAFDTGRKRLNTDVTLLPLADCGLAQLDQALNELAGLDPRHKRTVLTAAAACVSADHAVTIGEAELFRAFADTLDVPMPPLLPGQTLV